MEKGRLVEAICAGTAGPDGMEEPIGAVGAISHNIVAFQACKKIRRGSQVLCLDRGVRAIALRESALRRASPQNTKDAV